LGFGEREASAGGNEIASGSRLLGAKREIELSAHCRNYVTFYMLATITIKRPATQDYHLEPEEKIPSFIINSALSQIKNYALRRACIF
jgi:hypothetical protein